MFSVIRCQNSVTNKEVIKIKEYKIGNAIVRIRGKIDKEKIEEATKIFMKKVYQRKRNKNS